MIDLKAYLFRLTAVSVLCAVVCRLSPKKGAGRITRLSAGLLILISAFAPLMQVDLMESVRNLAENGAGDPLAATEIEIAAQSLYASYIKDFAESYILDKAQELGLTLTVDVECRREETYPVPWACTIRGNISAERQEYFSSWMETELGIPRERQEWLRM